MVSSQTSLTPSTRPFSRFALCALLVSQLVGVSFVLLTTAVADATAADVDGEVEANRSYWQEQYRLLLRNKATLEENIAKLEKQYAQAQRRNYPRGGARQKFLLQADEARTELKSTDEAITSMFDEARREGVPPGWLYEVEDEKIEAFQPAAADSAVDDEDRAGRNPRFFEKNEEDDRR